MNGLTTLLVAQLFCSAPAALNKTTFPWNAKDQYAKVQALVNCKSRYPDSPCLKCLFKTEKQSWVVLCSRKSLKGTELTNNEVECEEVWKKVNKLRRR